MMTELSSRHRKDYSMAGIFTMESVDVPAVTIKRLPALSAGEMCQWFRFYVDPGQPYLADHDVGVPLFGTVMSLEAMAQAWSQATGKIPDRITNIRSGVDLLVPQATELFCRVNGNHVVLCCRGNVLFQCECAKETFSSPDPFYAGTGSEKPVLTAGQLYQKFFHGPAFQVISEVYSPDAAILSHMNPQLPPLVDNGAMPILPVRMIEFALQSSGVYDLLTLESMKVPLGIKAVNLYLAASDAPQHDFFASVHPQTCGTGISVFDESGAIVLSIEGYTTKEMP